MPFARRRVHLVYNGITPPEYLPRVDARRVLAGHDAPQEFWIGSVAELHPNKNLSLLIDALSYMHAQGARAHVWLIGDGEQRDALKRQADGAGVAHHVHFSGYVENAARLFPAFDAVVLPSLKEGLPYVLMEAGGAGCAVVASNISGNNEIIEHDVSGLLVSHDATLLADALMRLANDPDTRSRFGAVLKQRIATTFSAERMYEETRALYI